MIYLSVATTAAAGKLLEGEGTIATPLIGASAQLRHHADALEGETGDRDDIALDEALEDVRQDTHAYSGEGFDGRALAHGVSARIGGKRSGERSGVKHHLDNLTGDAGEIHFFHSSLPLKVQRFLLIVT
jgi:hypothetical protein